MFVAQGFERASIDAITSSAGIAKLTVYRRYGDKKSLFKAALRRAIDQWIVPIDRLRAVERDDLEETLLAIGTVLVENVLSEAGLQLLRLTNAESGKMPEIGDYSVHQGSDLTLAYLADLFRRYLPEVGHVRRSADDVAEAFLHLVVGGPANAMAWGVVRSADAIDRRTRLSVSLFLHGLLAPPKTAL